MKKWNIFALLSITLLLFFITDRANSLDVSINFEGAIKCVKSTISSCTSSTTPGDYASTWNVSCDNVAITGLAVCAPKQADSANIGYAASNIWYDGTNKNDACWCRIIKPFVGNWVQGGACNESCARYCVEGMETNSTFRSNAYSSKRV